MDAEDGDHSEGGKTRRAPNAIAPAAEPAAGAFASPLRWDENLIPVRARDENRPEPGMMKRYSG
jgi:hypothetical protein